MTWRPGRGAYERLIKHPAKLFGCIEIADIAGVSYGSAKTWHRRGELPAPYAIVSRVPIWTREQIAEFFRKRAQQCPKQSTPPTRGRSAKSN